MYHRLFVLSSVVAAGDDDYEVGGAAFEAGGDSCCNFYIIEVGEGFGGVGHGGVQLVDGVAGEVFEVAGGVGGFDDVEAFFLKFFAFAGG